MGGGETPQAAAQQLWAPPGLERRRGELEEGGVTLHLCCYSGWAENSPFWAPGVKAPPPGKEGASQGEKAATEPVWEMASLPSLP